MDTSSILKSKERSSSVLTSSWPFIFFSLHLNLREICSHWLQILWIHSPWSLFQSGLCSHLSSKAVLINSAKLKSILGLHWTWPLSSIWHHWLFSSWKFFFFFFNLRNECWCCGSSQKFPHLKGCSAESLPCVAMRGSLWKAVLIVCDDNLFPIASSLFSYTQIKALTKRNRKHFSF